MFDVRYSKVLKKLYTNRRRGKQKQPVHCTAALYSFVSARVNRTRKNYTFLSLR